MDPAPMLDSTPDHDLKKGVHRANMTIGVNKLIL
jgi:hypothetical protein